MRHYVAFFPRTTGVYSLEYFLCPLHHLNVPGHFTAPRQGTYEVMLTNMLHKAAQLRSRQHQSAGVLQETCWGRHGERPKQALLTPRVHDATQL